jgi:hypothetical protein
VVVGRDRLPLAGDDDQHQRQLRYSRELESWMTLPLLGF